MAADGKTPPTHPQGGGGNIMCTCSIFVCRHKNNDMSTLLGHAHTYIPTDRQTDTQAYIHQSIQTYSYTHRWLHMCDLSPLWGGGWGGTRGAWIIYVLYLDPPRVSNFSPPVCFLVGKGLKFQTLGGFRYITFGVYVGLTSWSWSKLPRSRWWELPIF